MTMASSRVVKALFGLAACSLLATTCFSQAAADAGGPRILVLNKIKSHGNLPGNLVEMNVSTGEVLWRVPVGREPHEVAISDDGKLALVSNTGNYEAPGHTLTLVDVTNGRELKTIELGALGIPHGLGFSGGRFYFTSETAKALGRYDPATDKIDWIGGLGSEVIHMLAIGDEGNTIYVSERGSDSISKVAWNTGDANHPPSWTVTHWPVCSAPEGLDLAPGGKELWIGCRVANKIAVLDTATGKILRSMDVPTKALARVRLTLDGRYVLGSDLRTGTLVVIDPATMTLVKTISVGTGIEGILIAPDGQHAYIAATTDNYVAEIDLSSLTILRKLSSGIGPDGMAWIK